MAQRHRLTQINTVSPSFPTASDKIDHFVSDQELVDAKDDFVALVSHQLRTPLSVIRLYSEMLSEGLVGELTPAQHEHVAKLRVATIRIIDLANEIVAVSRAELGHITVHRKPLAAVPLIKSVIGRHQGQAAEKNLKIRFTHGRGLQNFAADRAIFRQIVSHLLSNAIRYSLPNGDPIVIDFRKQGDHYRLSVTDQGIGIPKDAQPHIFERFYRAPNTNEIVSDSTGLGLHLSQLLTKALDGRIWFKSQPEQGTSFYVELPAIT
jgi:signal transduction histidine kinase